MLRFIASRVLTLVPMLLILTVIVFLLVEIAPGDPAAIIAGADASPQAIEAVRQRLGLDQPVWQQYVSYVWAALQGDLGTSFVTNEPVAEVIARRLPRTLSIGLLAMLLVVVLSIPLGIIAAVKKGSFYDKFLTGSSVFLLAVPPFVLAAFLVKWFALGGLQFFPPTGYAPMSEGLGEWLLYATLPALAIATISLAELTRQARGAMVEALEQDYIRTARAKGLSKLAIVCKHAGKNASIPYITVLGLNVGRVVGAAVIIEAIFNIQGFGQLGVSSVINRDLPTMQGVVLVSGVIVLFVNLLVDISYGYLNPRIRNK